MLGSSRWPIQLLSTFVYLLLAACYDSEVSNNRRATPVPVAAPAVQESLDATTLADGPALYAIHCESCHNPLATSERIGAKAAGIISAIGRIAAMNRLQALKADEINAIAKALEGPAVVPTAPIVAAEDDDDEDDDDEDDDDEDDDDEDDVED